MLNPDMEKQKKQTTLLYCMKQTISPFLRLQIIKEAILADMVLTDYTKIINLDNWKQYMQQLIEDTPLSELMQIENAAKKHRPALRLLDGKIPLREKANAYTPRRP